MTGLAVAERVQVPVLPRGRAAGAAVACGYLLGALFVLSRLWARQGRGYLEDGFQDQYQWEWFFAATARAVAHGDGLLFTTLQNHPLGVNLMANTAMLGLAVPLTPVTLQFGPALTWSLVLTGGLAGSAFAWYLLFRRRLVGSRAAAVVGGACCGFAPPIISHANAHPNFVVLFVLPLIIDRLAELVTGRRAVRTGVTLGLLTAYQVFLGEEALLLAATGLAVFAVGYALARPGAARKAAEPLLKGLGAAAAVCLPLVAYPLWWQFGGPQSYTALIHGPAGNDVLALAGFARQSLAGHQAYDGPLAAGATEQNAFFGWPLAVLAIALVIWLHRSAVVRALALVIVTTALMSLGPEIVLNGRPTGIPGPWRLFQKLPLYESVVESRLTLVCVPAIGALVALGTERALAGRAPRWLWWLALAEALLPLTPKPLAAVDRPPVPAFFTTGAWRSYAAPGRAIVPVPLPDAADASAFGWQTATGMRFPVPQGYFVGPYGPDRRGAYGAEPRPTADLLRRVRDDGTVPEVTAADRTAAQDDLAFWRADAVVLGPHPRREALCATLEALLGPGEFTGGVWVWRTVGGRGGESAAGQ